MELLIAPNKFLTTPAGLVVGKTSEYTSYVAREMYRVMREHDGIGLAAPQVGKSERMCWVMVKEPRKGQNLSKDNFAFMVNPVLLPYSTATEDAEEGCLSVPDVRLIIRRYAHVSVMYLDAKLNFHSIQLHRLCARCAQHEIDHLDGILITRRAQQPFGADGAKAGGR